MIFYRPNNLKNLFELLENSNTINYFLAGGTDINLQIRNISKNSNIFYINHLNDLQNIKILDEHISIGATVTFSSIIHSNLLAKYLPFFQNSLKFFASPIIQNLATIGGNIVNGSPTNDVSPLLLILDAKLELISKNNSKIMPFNSFYRGYKEFDLQKNEILNAILIPKNAENNLDFFYQKVGARNSLTISKITVAGLKFIENNRIKKIKIALGSVNEYPRRLVNLENYLINKRINEIKKDEITKIIATEVTPISDLRSDKDYRFQVCLNLIDFFLGINF